MTDDKITLPDGTEIRTVMQEAEWVAPRSASSGGEDKLVDVIFAALELRYGEKSRFAAEYIAGLVRTPISDTSTDDAGLAQTKLIERLRHQISLEQRRADDNYSFGAEQMKRADAAERALARASSREGGAR